jgi:AcrR family transcriptional regulator
MVESSAGTPTIAARLTRGRRGERRAYTMRSRAVAAEATRDRISDAAESLFTEKPYDEVSLEAVATRARVSLPTVLRKFKSKEELFVACAGAANAREFEARAVAPGDVRAVARVLAHRYEELMPTWQRYLGLEDRFPAVADIMGQVRRGHLAWLAAAFAQFLPPRRGPRHTRRLAALFGATEIYLWWTFRTQLGLGAREAEQTMFETLDAIVGSFSATARRRPRHE